MFGKIFISDFFKNWNAILPFTLHLFARNADKHRGFADKW